MHLPGLSIVAVEVAGVDLEVGLEDQSRHGLDEIILSSFGQNPSTKREDKRCAEKQHHSTSVNDEGACDKGPQVRKQGIASIAHIPTGADKPIDALTKKFNCRPLISIMAIVACVLFIDSGCISVVILLRAFYVPAIVATAVTANTVES